MRLCRESGVEIIKEVWADVEDGTLLRLRAEIGVDEIVRRFFVFEA